MKIKIVNRIKKIFNLHLSRDPYDDELNNYSKIYEKKGEKEVIKSIMTNKKSLESINIVTEIFQNFELKENMLQQELDKINMEKNKKLKELNLIKNKINEINNNKIFYFCHNIENFTNLNKNILERINGNFNMIIIYNSGNIINHKNNNITFIKSNYNDQNIFDEIYNYSKKKYKENLIIFIKDIAIHINKNIVIDKNLIKQLYDQFKNNYCDILSPLIKHGNKLVYNGGFVNNDNSIYYINENDMSFNTKHMLYTRQTLMYFKDLYITNIENYVDSISTNNTYNYCKKNKILVNPFCCFNIISNNYNYNFKIPIDIEMETFRQYLNINNSRFLYSFKYLDYKTFSFNKNKNILIIEPVMLQIDQDCGSKFIFNFIENLIELNFNIFFFQDNYSKHWNHINLLRSKGVYVNIFNEHYLDDNNLERVLKYNYNLFDYIFISRLSGISKYYNLIKKYNSKSKIIFQTHDLNFLRENRNNKLKNLDYNKNLENTELDFIKKCDQTILVSNYEFNLLKNQYNISESKIFNLPIMFNRINRVNYNANDRRNFLFIGSHHSPNNDSLEYFLKNHFEKIIKYDNTIKFHVIGTCCNQINEEHIKKFPKNLILHFRIEDNKMSQIFNSCRLSIVPLRYGSGVKGKILDSFNYGLPVIASEIAIEGIKVSNNEDIIILNIDDPDFVLKFIKNYSNNDKLNHISKNCIELFDNNYERKNQKKYISKLINKIDNLKNKEIKPKKSKICIIYCIYDYNNSDKILKLFEELNDSYSYNIICINNNKNNVFKDKNKIKILQGSNKLNEFSAYDQAISHIYDNNLINNYSHYIIMNDTFLKNYPISSLINLNNDYIDNIFSDNNNVYGLIDSFNRTFNLDNFQFNNWIRTNFIVIPKNKLIFLKNNLCRFNIENTFNSNSSLKINCDKELYNLLINWLSQNRYNNLDNNKMLLKLCLIFNEYNLTNLFRKNKINIIQLKKEINTK